MRTASLTCQTTKTDPRVQTLKQQLSALCAKGWPFDDPQIYRVMMAQIGAADPQLRDELVYEGLCALIAGPLLSDAQINDLLGLAIDGLCFQVAHSGQGVLKRSFCSLVAAAIIEKDSARPCISDANMARLYDEMRRYALSEHDFRGHDPSLGWIHALAHFADLTDACLRGPRLIPAQKVQLILALVPMLCQRDIALSHDEDERVVTAVLTALRADLVDLPQILAALDCAGTPAQAYILQFNQKTFLKSLYLRLDAATPRALVFAQLRALTPYFYD